MLFLVGNVGEPIGYVFCVFPLVEFCLRPDFRVYTVENLLADFTEFAFSFLYRVRFFVFRFSSTATRKTAAM